MDDFLEKYLKETNTVLLTKDAFEYLKKRASAIEKIKTEIKWLDKAGHTAHNVDIALDAIKAVVAESEDKE